MHAVILAGGKGRRLRPYTTVFPKPLVPIGERPILEILILQLAQHGFTEVTLAVGYLSELIQAYLGDGNRYGVDIRYVKEDRPLGTAGPLKQIENQLPEHFICLNGDILTDLNFSGLIDSHIEGETPATISVFERTVDIDFGVVHANDNGHVTSWEEKPSLNYLVSMGAYALSKDALKYVDPDVRMDMPDLLMRLREEDRGVACYQHQGYWLDIGRPDDYEEANDPTVVDKIMSGVSS